MDTGQHWRRWLNIYQALGRCRLVLAASSLHYQTSVLLNAAEHCVSHIGVVEHCVSHIGVVPKRNIKSRLIQNLRPVRVVNHNCCKVRYQCEDNKTVAKLIEPKDDLVTVDI